MQKNDIAKFFVTEYLRDWRAVTIRVIRPDDKGRMYTLSRYIVVVF
jgi:hypothetical protein